MLNYILRRLLLMIPTLLGIMLVSFVVIQFVPGGPVERMIAELQGHGSEATSRFSGGGSSDFAAGGGATGDLSRQGTAFARGVAGDSPEAVKHGFLWSAEVRDGTLKSSRH